jgi:hypothetical protein
MIQLLFVFIVTVSSFSKADFFKAISGSDVATISKMIETIQKSTDGNDKNAYLGAMKMKKAEHQKVAKDKLSMFNEGKGLLEKAITKNNKNVEYRFLRLMIQENAPKILKYSANISEDAKMISYNYATLSTDVKAAVLNYSKNSSSLKI